MNLVLIKNLILINMWSIRILTFIYVCFLSIKATAQEIPNDIPSPTVASLAKFGDIPVSMFTGTPKITIPIFELKSLEKSMPISLDYDASGFQINALPNSVPTFVLFLGLIVSFRWYFSTITTMRKNASNNKRDQTGFCKRNL